MRQIVLFFILFPTIIYSQNNYSFASKKAFKKAQSEMELNHFDAANLLFKAVVKDEPTFSEAYLNMSIIEYSKKDFQKSLDLSQLALDNNKVQHAIYTQVGKSFFMLNNYDSSAYYFQLANLYGANTANDYYNLAKSENNLKNFSSALVNIEKAIEKDNKIADYFVVKGNSNLGSFNYDAAKNDYNKALELNPNQSNLYANLAKVNIETGNSEAALANIKKGLDSADGNEKIAFLLLQGNYLKSNNEIDKAESSFNKAFEIDNNNASVLINQSAIMIKKGDYEKAVEKCTEAIEIDGVMHEAYFNRGIAYEMLKNTEDACSDWEVAFIMGSVKAEEFINSPTCNE